MSEGDAPTIDVSTAAVLSAPDLHGVEAALQAGWDLTVAVSSLPSVFVDQRLRAMQAIVGHTSGLDAVLITNLDNVRALSGSPDRLVGSSSRVHRRT